MIIAYWHIDHPWSISLIEEELLPVRNANWIEERPATPEEIEMYKKGISDYKISKDGTIKLYK